MIETLDHSSFVELVVTLWAIWFARQRLIHDGEQQSPISTFAFVRSFLDDLAMMTSSPPVHGKQGKAKQTISWIAPPIGYSKLNVDAATSRSGTGGAVAVALARRVFFLGPRLS
jgi:hypothetical protein